MPDLSKTQQFLIVAVTDDGEEHAIPVDQLCGQPFKLNLFQLGRVLTLEVHTRDLPNDGPVELWSKDTPVEADLRNCVVPRCVICQGSGILARVEDSNRAIPCVECAGTGYEQMRPIYLDGRHDPLGNKG